MSGSPTTGRATRPSGWPRTRSATRTGTPAPSRPSDRARGLRLCRRSGRGVGVRVVDVLEVVDIDEDGPGASGGLVDEVVENAPIAPPGQGVLHGGLTDSVGLGGKLAPAPGA